jgi:hypothetical protein
MEDRMTAGLYLEMSNCSPDEYRGTRVPDVMALTGVKRATWWENAHPYRKDLPRTVEEFSLLGLYEADEDFNAPDHALEIRGHHYRRYPRPAQGSLTGRPTLGLLLVLVSPRQPDGAQALRDWADFVHLRHIAEASVPGYTMITPYENATDTGPRFLHLYEMDTGDPESTFRSMTPLVQRRLGGGPGTLGFDQWMGHPQLRIDYVNTFRRLGAWVLAARSAAGRGGARR